MLILKLYSKSLSLCFLVSLKLNSNQSYITLNWKNIWVSKYWKQILKTLLILKKLLKSLSCSCYCVFLYHSNWTQISLKSHSIGRIFWSQNRLDKKHLSNQLFPEQPKKTKTLKSHSMHFLLRISFNFHVLQKQPKIFKLHSGAYRQPLDVCGRPFAPPPPGLLYSTFSSVVCCLPPVVLLFSSRLRSFVVIGCVSGKTW